MGNNASATTAISNTAIANEINVSKCGWSKMLLFVGKGLYFFKSIKCKSESCFGSQMHIVIAKKSPQNCSSCWFFSFSLFPVSKRQEIVLSVFLQSYLTPTPPDPRTA